MAALDFTRQMRVRQDLDKQPSNFKIKVWTDYVDSLELPVQYACACPLTNDELAAYAHMGGYGPKRAGGNGAALAYRFKKVFTSWDPEIPLCDVPEIELALQAMLVCSLEQAECLATTELHALQKLVQSYWKEVMSVFSTCVEEIRLSTCPEIEDYRQWFKYPVARQSIFLIPIGDVNHPRARFYAYPQVWEVFATVFGEEYKEKMSFYCAFPNAQPESDTTIAVSRAAAAAEARAAAIVPPSSAPAASLQRRSSDTESDGEDEYIV